MRCFDSEDQREHFTLGRVKGSEELGAEFRGGSLLIRAEKHRDSTRLADLTILLDINDAAE